VARKKHTIEGTGNNSKSGDNSTYRTHVPSEQQSAGLKREGKKHTKKKTGQTYTDELCRGNRSRR